MKRIVIIILLTLSLASAYSQEYEPKNVLRGGASLVFCGGDNYRGKFELNVGNQIAVEYSRKLSSIYSLDVSLFKQNYHSSSQRDCYEYKEPFFSRKTITGIYARNIFIPFRKAKWFRPGIGVFAEYASTFSSNNDVTFEQAKSMFYGMSLPIRFYILDTKRFDLYGYYEFVVRISYSNNSYRENNKHFYRPYNLCGVMFGVKF